MGRLLSFLCSLLVILAIFESCYRRTSNLITLESAISGADCHRGNEIIYSPYTKGDKIDKDAGYDTKCDCTSSFFGCPARMSCEKNIKCVDKETCGLMGTSSCVGVCL